jgi:hypothetical protein
MRRELMKSWLKRIFSFFFGQDWEDPASCDDRRQEWRRDEDRQVQQAHLMLTEEQFDEMMYRHEQRQVSEQDTEKEQDSHANRHAMPFNAQEYKDRGKDVIAPRHRYDNHLWHYPLEAPETFQETSDEPEPGFVSRRVQENIQTNTLLPGQKKGAAKAGEKKPYGGDNLTTDPTQKEKPQRVKGAVGNLALIGGTFVTVSKLGELLDLSVEDVNLALTLLGLQDSNQTRSLLARQQRLVAERCLPEVTRWDVRVVRLIQDIRHKVA